MYNETEKQTDRISVVCVSVNQCAIEMSIVIGSVSHQRFSNQQSRETVEGTSASITVSSVTTLNNTFKNSF